MSITLKHLTAFGEVARLGSFTRAAEELHISQPALTVTITQFEELLGIKLFDRTTRRVSLTREGESFLPTARRLLADFNEAITDLREVAELRRGRVRLAALPSVAVHMLPPIVSRFSENHPAISVHLHDANASGVQQMVATGDVDLGIANRWDDDPDLAFRPLFKDPVGLVCRADHPLASDKGPLAWKALAGHAIIGSAATSGIRALVQAVDRLPENVRAPRYEVSHIATMEGLLMAGLGVSALPALAVPQLRDQDLVFRRLTEPKVDREVALITRRGRHLAPAARALFDLISHARPPRWKY